VQIAREHGISEVTFYNWKQKYGGLEASELKRLKDLEDENRRLKKMYAELSLDHEIVKEALKKSGRTCSTSSVDPVDYQSKSL